MESPSPPASETPGPPPTRPPSQRPAHASAPLWLWFLLVGGFTLIFWRFVPAAEVLVEYSPWFLDQVEADNIRILSIQGNALRGEVRVDVPQPQDAKGRTVSIRRFVTYFPGGTSIDSVIRKLRDGSKSRDPVRIETSPAATETHWLWGALILQTFLLLLLLHRVDSLGARLHREGDEPRRRNGTGTGRT